MNMKYKAVLWIILWFLINQTLSSEEKLEFDDKKIQTTQDQQEVTETIEVKKRFIYNDQTNNHDIVDAFEVPIKKNIQRIQRQTQTPLISPTIANVLYHQTTTNEVKAKFYPDRFVSRVIIRSRFLHKLPGKRIVQESHFHTLPDQPIHEEITEEFDDKVCIVTNNPPPYHYDTVIQRLSIAMNPTVSQLSIDFSRNFTPVARHIHLEYDPSADKKRHCLELLKLSYWDPLDTIDLRQIPYVRLVIIQTLKFSGSTEITLPKKVSTFELKSEFTEKAEHAAGMSIFGTEITQKLIVRCSTIAVLTGIGSQILMFDHVHFLTRSAFDGFTTPIQHLSFIGGSWPAQGLDLSVIPSVARLDFAFLDSHSPATLAKFVFPHSVGTMEFGQGAYLLIKHLDPTTFASRVQEIHVDVWLTPVDQKNFKNDCIPNLCQAILPVGTLPEFIDQCIHRITIIIENHHRLPDNPVIINVSELKDYLTNASYDYAQNKNKNKTHDQEIFFAE